MLIFPLRKEWYEKIKSGEKTVEYREVKPYWIKRIDKITGGANRFHKRNYGWYYGFYFENLPICKLRLGYTNKYLQAKIEHIDILNTGEYTALHIDKPVYAIHLTDVREVKE